MGRHYTRQRGRRRPKYWSSADVPILKFNDGDRETLKSEFCGNLPDTVIEAIEQGITVEFYLLKCDREVQSRAMPAKEETAILNHLQKSVHDLYLELQYQFRKLPLGTKEEIIGWPDSPYFELKYQLRNLESILKRIHRPQGSAGPDEDDLKFLVLEVEQVMLKHGIKLQRRSNQFLQIISIVLRTVGEDEDAAEAKVRSLIRLLNKEKIQAKS